MRGLMVIILLFLNVGIFAQKDTSNTKYNNFKLTYVIIGRGSKWPVFEVRGSEFIYVYKKTGWSWGRDTLSKIDTICRGYLRPSSMDSILDIISNRKDTLVYKYNNHVKDGLKSYISVSKDSLKIKFELNNAGDSDVERIVNILNSNTPFDKSKLRVCCDYKRNRKEE